MMESLRDTTNVTSRGSAIKIRNSYVVWFYVRGSMFELTG